jgi:hypothetical protein
MMIFLLTVFEQVIQGGTMPGKNRKSISRVLLFVLALFGIVFSNGSAKTNNLTTEKIENGWKSISEPLLMEHVNELCMEKYAGRLTGTKGYDDAAAWVAGRLAQWELAPGGESGTYFQEFPNSYTLVLPGAGLALRAPGADGDVQQKSYEIESDFFPGSTSGSGEVTAEVVYVGYGISAPELGFDEYKGLDVKGKIVLVEVEVPVDPVKRPGEFARWRPYSFHQYKMRNAREHGAAGVLFNYLIVNPNCAYYADLLWTAVGDKVVNDIFQGGARDHGRVVKAIWKKHRPQSFATGKTATIKNVTEHHPEGVGKNVIAFLPGSDPLLQKEVILLTAHLDHLGLNPTMMPGANDNASGVAVVMAVAEALAKFGLRPGRTIAFILFGAEEQGVRGSEYLLRHRPPLLEKMKAVINLDGVGRGKKLHALAGKNYPSLWKFFDVANRTLVGVEISGEFFHNRARPRLDAAHFMWAGIPTVSFSADGEPALPFPCYHTRHDRPEFLTPGIMVKLGRLIFAALVDLAACR